MRSTGVTFAHAWLRGRASLCLVALTLLIAGNATGAVMRPDDVPAPLKPWVPWALHAAREPECPLMNRQGQERNCIWPGRLALDLKNGGGKFTQSFTVYGEPGSSAWVALPGNAQRWPQRVQVNDKPWPVLDLSGAPGLYLLPGEYRIAGEFNWSVAPDTITIPPRTGTVSLALNGEVQSEPRWDANGVLALTQADRSAKTVERIETRVTRLITDDTPVTVTTRLTLLVAGRNREVALAGWLPTDAIPTGINSALPARLDADRKLVLQVRPGQWEVVVTARMPGPVRQLSAPKVEGIGEEVWAFAPRPVLRQVTVAGPPQVDPQQTALPPEWRQFPAYRLKPGDVMSFNDTRRGDPNPNPDQLAIARNLWLDFDGNGYTLQDDISGSLSRSWRLSLAAPYVLGRAAMAGREQLITIDAEKQAGIEVRVGQAQIIAESRLASAARELPAAGWSFDPHRLSTMLHLPPGWRLFAVSGVDRADGAWVSLWTLLDFFLVLVAAVAAFRLWGGAWGAATLLLLIFTWQEADAPRWLWLNLIGAAALSHALRNTRLGIWLRRYSMAAWLAVVVVALPFAVTQVRATLYPALGVHGVGGESGELAQEPPPAPAPAMAGAEAPASADGPAVADEARAPVAAEASRRVLRKESKNESRYSASSTVASSRLDEIDPKAVVQTGPGLPRWRWNTHALTWNGPVEKSQTMTIWLLPPWSKALITIAQLLLLAALLKRTLGLLAWREALPERFSGASVAASVLALLMLAPPWKGAQAASPVNARPALAEKDSVGGATRAGANDTAASAAYPSAELLNELRQRLTAPPPACRPNCAVIARLLVENAGAELRLRIEVQAAAPVAVPLPGGARQWSPEQVLLNGTPVGALRDGVETLWVAVPAGVHQIVMQGRLPGRDVLQLALPLKPRRVETGLTGWRLDGVDADGVPEESLQLSRLAQAGREAGAVAKEGAGTEGNIAPFVAVERTLSLGLEWRVRTRVVRTNVAGQPVVIEYPLLPGESVLTPDVKTEGGRARVNLGPQMGEAVFESALAIAPTINLVAARQTDWVEAWRLDVGTQWHVELSGIPMIHRQSAGRYLPQWQPWPGETVTIAATRPMASAGAWLTLDEARAELTPGSRVTDFVLTLALRASRGGNHVIDLPAGVTLQQAALNGASAPLKTESAKLTLPIAPGAQNVTLTLRANQGMELLYATPAIGLNLPGLNQHIHLNPPRERWILWFSGPRLGPAIMLWGVVLVLCLVGVALGRTGLTPLRSWQWILLLLGLTQAPFEAGLIIVGWLFAIALREKSAARLAESGWLNAAQVGLALLTLAALMMLLDAVKSTLLGLPQMQIEGNGSSAASLRWFLDRGEFPQAHVVSLPLWLWRGVMLVWALWLAWSLVVWLKWGWAAMNTGGLWRKHVEKRIRAINTASDETAAHPAYPAADAIAATAATATATAATTATSGDPATEKSAETAADKAGEAAGAADAPAQPAATKEVPPS